MNSEKVLAKIVAVNGKDSLSPQFENDYFPEIDMYLFYTECTYDFLTGSYQGVRKLHDRLIADRKIPSVPTNTISYISIDVKASDKRHTYMTSNKRCYQLSYDQKQFIANMFNADFF